MGNATVANRGNEIVANAKTANKATASGQPSYAGIYSRLSLCGPRSNHCEPNALASGVARLSDISLRPAASANGSQVAPINAVPLH